MTECDCCKEQVQQVDEQGLCFSCSPVQEFASSIEEHTELSDDDALDLACKLVVVVRSRVPGWTGPRKVGPDSSTM